MAELISTKPYMIRAIHEWCVDNDLTPHLLAVVDAHTRVPMAYVKDGEIVLSMSYSAVKDLHIDNDAIVFSARFSGVAHRIYIPMAVVKGVFARENGQGMFFEPEMDGGQPVSVADEVVQPDDDADKKSEVKGKPSLRIVK